MPKKTTDNKNVGNKSNKSNEGWKTQFNSRKKEVGQISPPPAPPPRKTTTN
ncbi:hypothetical protein MKY08_09430 [Lysinibacillus sp. FSL M8-0337]|uniref:hypothetical protein n=1 Tax=Lysinibacillus TaxID=400634 RepID=UPI0015B3A04B|nr:hypothetical protein [Lysinibacillus sphaericus]